MNSITIVLRSGMGMQIDSVRPYLRNGMPIAIGRAGAVISHFADGDAHLALRTIAEYPCPEQDNMPAANMREIALAALDGAGASSEPGNPGGEPVSGPGNAGEQTHPAPGLAREHAELRRIAVALKNPLLSGEEASNLMVRYEALTMPDHIIALIDGQTQAIVPKGWKLVPLEPTPEMLDARRDSEDGMDGYLVEDTEYYFPDRGAVRDFLACVYRGLLAAAPAPGGER
ncbi:hypothetical protein [Pseudomonas aeruginosa]|uniref:hypothetical protein n=1 Tax=Pseudomonas aeruginosa TaxID=287 RepID=UPI000AB31E6D|nr:hypothetical protein [Pseudomonas aeruginosa]SPY51524.1 Uncharacterised protein [Pseudomonas aeruginosa]